MIIACYAGVGKSIFASMYPKDTPDLYSMPYKWILPEIHEKKGEFENVKASPYLLLNPAFPKNYLAAVLETELTSQLTNFDYEPLVRHFPIAYTFCEVQNFLIQGV